jgi:hypothetical protein
MALIAFTWNPPPKQLRWFGCLWLPLALGGVAYGIASFPGRIALGAVAALSLVVGLAAPRLLRPVFVGLLLLTWPVGFVMSHVILAAIFFLVLTPTAWLMRVFGRKGLDLALDPKAASYWRPRQGRAPLPRYFDQS